jgi:hypothetical protein
MATNKKNRWYSSTSHNRRLVQPFSFDLKVDTMRIMAGQEGGKRCVVTGQWSGTTEIPHLIFLKWCPFKAPRPC